MENNCVELVQNQLLQEEDGATSSTPVELEENMGGLDLESNSLMHIRNIDRNVDNTNRNRIQERTMPQLQPLYDHVGMLQQLNHVYQLPKLPSSFGHVEQLTPFSRHVYQLPQLPPGCGLSGAVGMIKSLHPPQHQLPDRSMAAVGMMGILQTPQPLAPGRSIAVVGMMNRNGKDSLHAQQPSPPARSMAAIGTMGILQTPQPLPPGRSIAVVGVMNRNGRDSLQPQQPSPPATSSTSSFNRAV
jgi:hypothetical protein